MALWQHLSILKPFFSAYYISLKFLSIDVHVIESKSVNNFEHSRGS